jgi:hypothetical protein
LEDENEESDGEKKKNGYVEVSEYVDLLCIFEKDGINTEQEFFPCVEKSIEIDVQYGSGERQ